MSERVYQTLKTVHENDIDRLLSKYGLLEQLNKKEIKCAFCNNVVAKDSIYSFYRELNSIKIICSQRDCVTRFLEFLDNKKNKPIEE